MTENPRNLHDGELDNDADLDPIGTEPEAETGEGYVDPVEQKLESQLPQGYPAAEPNQLP